MRNVSNTHVSYKSKDYCTIYNQGIKTGCLHAEKGSVNTVLWSLRNISCAASVCTLTEKHTRDEMTAPLDCFIIDLQYLSSSLKTMKLWIFWNNIVNSRNNFQTEQTVATKVPTFRFVPPTFTDLSSLEDPQQWLTVFTVCGDVEVDRYKLVTTGLLYTDIFKVFFITNWCCIPKEYYCNLFLTILL